MRCQRWAQGGSHEAPDEPVRRGDYEVAPILDDATAKAFVLEHHYSGTYPAARYRYGLYRHGRLKGVAVFSQPSNNKVVTNSLPGLTHLEGVELGRFVLLDGVPRCGETLFLGGCFAELRKAPAPQNWPDDRPWRGVRGVVSFADPVRRQTDDGRVVLPGHVGVIYQAHNGVYTGRGTRRTLRLLADARVFSDRAAQKIRKRERGWEYAVEQLVAAGARSPGDSEDLAAWLRRELSRITRPLRHRGNHRYVWPTRARDKQLRRAIEVSRQPYPKEVDA